MSRTGASRPFAARDLALASLCAATLLAVSLVAVGPGRADDSRALAPGPQNLSAPIAPGAGRTLEIACPPGTVVVGAGLRILPSDAPVEALSGLTNPSGPLWSAWVRNTGTRTVTVSASASCDAPAPTA